MLRAYDGHPQLPSVSTKMYRYAQQIRWSLQTLKSWMLNWITIYSLVRVICVNVGIFIPPSMIKILLLHCILGVSLSQLHSIRSMDHLTVVACCNFFPHVLYLLAHFHSLRSSAVTFCLIICKESFLGFQFHQVQGFIRKVFKMSNNGQQVHEEVEQSSSIK